ncbi:MAG: hypothetical protein Q8L27_02470 [archaeon]|nr:hypothetical protein [archaeon]
MIDATILYYSSNRETTEFESKIQKTLSKNCWNIPIISVTQKPIDLGKNICVGNVGESGFNMCRQILIGCENATTKYVISAEADCIYPEDYFLFIPSKDDVCYRNNNTYIMGNKRDYFFLKREGGTWCQIVNREFYIKRLKYLFEGAPTWSTKEKNFPKTRGKKFFDSFETFTTTNPCISFKSGKGMRHYTHSERIPIYSLPYWGDSKDLRKKYLC